MEGFIGEIEEISADIKLIALNAQVKANLAGSEGKTLGVIAEEVRALASEAGAAANSEQDKDNVNNEDMTTALRGLLKPLERINAGFISLLNKITENGQNLGTKLMSFPGRLYFTKI